ncbi:nucleotide pyrophosphohydrolase [Candidatus Kaiserbacteria bacterium]|nr:nucleotide pyrophosphohydrolase [Candidatus Kaiserbacteria bacterium]
MRDSETHVAELKKMVEDFRDARDWKQYNDPKNLAEALSIEAAELLECFLWKDKEAVAEKIKNDSVWRERFTEELADVFIYSFHLANDTGTDITEAVKNKIAKNEQKYPIGEWKGKVNKNV